MIIFIINYEIKKAYNKLFLNILNAINNKLK